MSALRQVGLAVVAASACTGVAVASAQVDGNRLRERLPEPGRSVPAATHHFAGLERAGTHAIAVVVHRNGSALAFVCDGKRAWRWLTGRVQRGRLVLRGERGARLTGTVGGSRLSGTLRLAGKARRFSLPRSPRRLGLRRLEEGRFEAAWIATRAGQIRGVGTLGKTTAISASADSTPTPDDGTAPAGDNEVSTRLFTKARCALIQLQADIIRFRQDQGTLSAQDRLDFAVLGAKFEALHCREVLAGAEAQP